MDRDMRYFVEFHFAQVTDGWALPMRELQERYVAALTILYGEPDSNDEDKAIDELVDEILRGK